ncbi:hypothetical protein J5N97_002225 [Dioscorea zingiberensis]|uniref:Trichome birefringence-like N-terminal domain-containing protein n=1 Tax=Dioscorea zingiberensis TaxID=325984 RepID=A0A9D5HP58_9LILI|nr:hypothetical protein J5N97_002225 [Dioscorea zingiberensis]
MEFCSYSFYFIAVSSIIIIFVTTFYSKDFTNIFEKSKLQLEQQKQVENEVLLPFAMEEEKECNVFEGSWVYDETSRPMYQEHECPLVEEKITCQAHGRPDKDYQHWRWQPHSCSLPSFNATLMLEKLRGKTMIFVGDSLNRGQFSSMICLLQRSIPKHAKSFEIHEPRFIFKAKEYNATIEFYWAPFLLESNCDDFYYHRRRTDRTVREGSIDVHAQHWKEADILVFNTYIWWMTGFKLKIIRERGKGGMEEMIEMEAEDAYRMGLKELVGWVEKNMDPTKTRIFFVTMSASHSMSWEWGGEKDGNCYNETRLIEDQNYWGSYSRRNIMEVIKEELSASKVPISVLNITQLSEYRKDAHVSIYQKHDHPLKPEELAHPQSYADCFHWCVPGVPDVWNELLYTKLFFP